MLFILVLIKICEAIEPQFGNEFDKGREVKI